jgi:CYTH domain-containing protein
MVAPPAGVGEAQALSCMTACQYTTIRSVSGVLSVSRARQRSSSRDHAMAKEIERKFLVNTALWRAAAGTPYRQGYLSSVNERVVRVRIAGDRGFLTIKGLTTGVSRLEFEYPIPLADAAVMLDQICERPLIEKTRHLEVFAGRKWEIDVFHGDNDGLVVAEVELENPEDKIGCRVGQVPRFRMTSATSTTTLQQTRTESGGTIMLELCFCTRLVRALCRGKQRSQRSPPAWFDSPSNLPPHFCGKKVACRFGSGRHLPRSRVRHRSGE